MADPERDDVTGFIRRFHAIEPPNDAALRLAAQLTETIAAFARLRVPPPLEAPPGDFTATLRALRDDPG